MKRIIIGLSLSLVLVSVALAQKTTTNASATAIQETTSSLGVASGTHVSGQLQNSLDVNKAKVGDQVLLKTTSAVKQDGQVVIAKGSRLIGHVADVQKKGKGQASSSIGVVFDRLQQGGNQIPISAVITSVLSAGSAASISDSAMADSTIMSSSQTSARSSGSGSGGLLGGVTNTAGNGGLLGGVTNTVGSVVNTTTQTVGGVTNTVGSSTSALTNIRGLTVSNSTSASAQGGSTLSLSGGNLRLDKGTTFNLSLNNSTSVSRN
jgi:hypothetical protein